jgi:hypothetical protein
MKKRGSWKFSQVGAALFLLTLFAPFIVGLLKLWPEGGAQIWAWPIFLVLTLFSSALIWFVSLRPLIRQQLWKIPRTWYEACFGITLLYLIYALIVFVTGYTPSKYNSHRVPRSAGVIFLYRAAAPLIVGVAFYLYGKYKRNAR